MDIDIDIGILIDTISTTTEDKKDEGRKDEDKRNEDKRDEDKSDEDKSDEDQTELENAKNQILGIAKPQIETTTIDKIDLPQSSDPREKAMATYKKAIKERKEIEFNKRLKAQEFKNDIRRSASNIKIDNTLSNRPNKKGKDKFLGR